MEIAHTTRSALVSVCVALVQCFPAKNYPGKLSDDQIILTKEGSAPRHDQPSAGAVVKVRSWKRSGDSSSKWSQKKGAALTTTTTTTSYVCCLPVVWLD